MLTFCPNCCNTLIVGQGNDLGMEFQCKTCPYIFPILPSMQVFDRTKMKQKQIDDVLGGSGAWDNVDQTTAQCPTDCGNDKAYFFQLQIRSADEPMTTFYKCTKCGHQWKEN